MKLKLLGAAIAAVMTCAPASAATWVFAIGVPAVGTASTRSCAPPGICVETEKAISETLKMFIAVADFDPSVSFGEEAYHDFFGRGDYVGSYKGIIEWLPNGAGFIGRDFQYVGSTFDKCQEESCPPVTTTRLAASTFSANFVEAYDGPAPVPEPATWAMMLLGFGAIGHSMRRRRVSYKTHRAV